MSLYQYERDGDLQSLADILVSAENVMVRRQAAESIGEIDPPQDRSQGEYEAALSALRTTAIEDDDEEVRTTAVTALEHHGITEVKRLIRDIIGKPLEAISPRTYASLLKADRPEIRLVGLVAIGLEGTPSYGDVVIEAFDDVDPRVRERAIAAAMNLGLGRAADHLVGALDDPAPNVRAAAATAIGELNIKGAAPALATATKDETEAVRLSALDALAGLGSPEAIEPLSDALGSSIPAVNRLAVYGLLELLSSGSGSASHQLREQVQAIAQDAPRTTVIDTLIELLAEMDGVLQRRNAIWLLGQLIDSPPSADAVEVLVDHVGDDDDQTGKLATSALVRSEGVVVETAVRNRFRQLSPDAPATGQLAYILGRIGSSRSIDALEEQLERSDDESVRRQIMAALRRLEAKRGVTG